MIGWVGARGGRGRRGWQRWAAPPRRRRRLRPKQPQKKLLKGERRFHICHRSKVRQTLNALNLTKPAPAHNKERVARAPEKDASRCHPARFCPKPSSRRNNQRELWLAPCKRAATCHAEINAQVRERARFQARRCRVEARAKPSLCGDPEAPNLPGEITRRHGYLTVWLERLRAQATEFGVCVSERAPAPHRAPTHKKQHRVPPWPR